jgi:NTP pyrophosphatase (non-canonical NTP hydrolase)
MTQIERMADEVAQFCKERDWDQFHGPKDLAIGLVTEASEVLEKFRFLSESEALEVFQDSEKRTELEDEIADTLFFILRFAQRHKIDLEKSLTAKIAKSAAKYPIEKARGSNRKYDQL